MDRAAEFTQQRFLGSDISAGRAGGEDQRDCQGLGGIGLGRGSAAPVHILTGDFNPRRAPPEAFGAERFVQPGQIGPRAREQPIAISGRGFGEFYQLRNGPYGRNQGPVVILGDFNTIWDGGRFLRCQRVGQDEAGA